jgi:hypothetical protein
MHEGQLREVDAHEQHGAVMVCERFERRPHVIRPLRSDELGREGANRSKGAKGMSTAMPLGAIQDGSGKRTHGGVND